LKMAEAGEKNIEIAQKLLENEVKGARGSSRSETYIEILEVVIISLAPYLLLGVAIKRRYGMTIRPSFMANLIG